MLADPILILVGPERAGQFLDAVDALPDDPGVDRWSSAGPLLVERGLLSTYQLQVVDGDGPRDLLACESCKTALVRIGVGSLPAPPCPVCAGPLAPVPKGGPCDLFAAWLLQRRTAPPPREDRKALDDCRPAEPEDAPPKPSWGPYEIEKTLGSGGMGVVFKAFDKRIQREVALKALKGDRVTPEDRERFILEARVMGRLEHPNIVPVHELSFGFVLPSVARLRSSVEGTQKAAPPGSPAGSPPGERQNTLMASQEKGDPPASGDSLPCFAMKLVHGWSLKDVLTAVHGGEPAPVIPSGTGWTLRAFLDVFLKVCDAVAFAHSRGILHRDLKPANVMVGSYGEVLLTDWGLAKVKGTEEPRGSAVDSRPLPASAAVTVDGHILGTPCYMAPEQARGEVHDLDERSDVYSLGALLYEILTGHPPYEGGNAAEVVLKVQNGHLIPPSQRVEGRPVPRELEQVVLKCLALSKQDRYGSVPDLAADVRRFLEGDVLAAVRYGPLELAWKWMVRHRSVVVPVVLSALAVLTFYGWTMTQPGTLVLDSIPSGATVFRGHAQLGQTPLIVQLPAGVHQIRLAREDHQELTCPVWIGHNTTSAYRLPLVSRQGVLLLTSSPVGARVAVVDSTGRPVVRTRTTTNVLVPEGTGYVLEFSMPGYVSTTLTGIAIPGGRDLAQHHGTLSRDSGFMKIRTLSDGARMTVRSETMEFARTYLLPIVEPVELLTGLWQVSFWTAGAFRREVPVEIERARTTSITAHCPALKVVSRAALGPSTGTAVLAADLDGDRKDDLAMITAAGELAAVSGGGGGELFRTTVGPSASSEGVFGPVAGDLDGDGRIDLAVNAGGATCVVSGRDGAVLWRTVHKGRLVTSPVIVPVDRARLAVLVATGDRAVVALDGATGTPLWRSPVGSGLPTSPAAGDLDADGRPEVVVATTAGDAVALSGADGRTIWSRRAGRPFAVGPLVVPGAGPGGALVVTASTAGVLSGLRATTGEPVWTSEAGPRAASPLGWATLGPGGPAVVFVTEERTVQAVDATSGRTLWRRRCGAAGFASPALADLNGDRFAEVVVATVAQGALVLSGTDGRTLLALQVEGKRPIVASPAVADVNGDGLPEIIAASPGQVVAFDTSPGLDRWTFQSPHDWAAVEHLAIDGVPWLIGVTTAGDVIRVRAENGVGETVVRTGRSGPRGLVPSQATVAASVKLALVYPDEIRGIGWDRRELWTRSLPGADLAGAVSYEDRASGTTVLVAVGSGPVRFLDMNSGRDLRNVAAVGAPLGPPALIARADGQARFVAVGGGLGRFRALSCRPGSLGATVWTTGLGGPILSLESTADLDLDGWSDLLVTSNGRILARSGQTGSPLWEHDTGGGPARCSTVEQPGQSTRILVVSPRLFEALDGRTGRSLESRPLLWPPSSPAAGRVTGPDRGLETCYVATDGRLHSPSAGADDGLSWPLIGPATRQPLLLESKTDGIRAVVAERTTLQCLAVQRPVSAGWWSLARSRSWLPRQR